MRRRNSGRSHSSVLLISFLIMYVVEAYGWKVTSGLGEGYSVLGVCSRSGSAGEFVNMTTPTAYVGGEPLKAYLLKKHHVPMVEGNAF